MVEFAAGKFTIDSTLELVADRWEAQVPDSALFRGASTADRVTLAAGLLDGSGSPVIIQSVTQGVIDEYELTVTKDNIVGVVRGRDPAALLLDSYVDIGFARPALSANLGRAFTEVLPSFDLAARVAPTATVGESRASMIAKKVVETAGLMASVPLTLQWEARDYDVVGTFQASGRVVEILRRLVEPWTLVEPYRVDIYVQGTTVIVRHRQLPGQPITAAAENTMTLAAARRARLTVRKRPFKKLGTVTLRGRRKPQGLARVETSTGGFVSVQLTSSEAIIKYKNEAFDAGGTLAQSTEMVDTFRVPDRILLRSVATTIGKANGGGTGMLKRLTVENTWEDTVYDGTGPITAAKQLSQGTKVELLDPEDQIFRDDQADFTAYAYDDNGFLTGETTITRAFDKDASQLKIKEMVVKSLHDVGPLISESVVEKYDYDSDTKKWILRQRQTSLGGGHRPGGAGRGVGTAGLPQNAGALAFDQETLTQTFSEDADAIPVEYANENLSAADLRFLMDQFAAAVGLWEYEYGFDGVAMPWLRRGTAFQVVGLLAEDDVTPIPLPAAIMTEVGSTYDESSARAQYTMRSRAFGWTAG